MSIPGGKANPEKLKERFPHLTAEQCQSISKQKGGILSEKRQEQFLKFLHMGYIKPEAERRVHCSDATIEFTRLAYPDFDRQIRNITKLMKRKVESSLIRYCLGLMKSSKKTYVAKLDNNGDPVYDEKGKQQFICTRIEINKLPATAGLLELYLKAVYPDRYDKDGKAISNNTAVFLGVEDLKDELNKRLHLYEHEKAKLLEPPKP